MLTDAEREPLAELTPVLRRAITLDPKSLIRIRLRGVSASVLVRLPFGVLVSRTVEAPTRAEPLDTTVRAADAIAWLDGETAAAPQARDAEWRSGLPPAVGWARVEAVPDEVVRSLVRSGAAALTVAAVREGVPGAEPRAEVADALLDSVVLTVTDDAGVSADVTLRALGALTRMGFLARGGEVRIHTAGRWVRVAAEYGSVYLQRPGSGLSLA